MTLPSLPRDNGYRTQALRYMGLAAQGEGCIAGR